MQYPVYCLSKFFFISLNQIFPIFYAHYKTDIPGYLQLVRVVKLSRFPSAYLLLKSIPIFGSRDYLFSLFLPSKNIIYILVTYEV